MGVIAIISAYLRISFKKFEYAQRDWYFYEHIFTLVEGFENLSSLLDAMKDRCVYPLDQSVRKIRDFKNSLLSESLDTCGKENTPLKKKELIEHYESQQHKGNSRKIENLELSSDNKHLQTFLENFKGSKERDEEDRDNASTDYSMEDDDWVDEEEDDIDETVESYNETVEDTKLKSKQTKVNNERIDSIRNGRENEKEVKIPESNESSAIRCNKNSNINEELPDPISISVSTKD